MGKDGFGRLEHEWRMYLTASKHQLDGVVVPRCFGLFKHNNFAVLVTEYVGESIPDVAELDKGDRCV